MNPVQPWLHDRPVRNNNPGDLRPRGEAPAWPGQDGVDRGAGGPFAIFPTPADGWAALALWCLDARYLRGLRTARQMIEVFAPPTENATAAYAAGVVARLGEGSLDLSNPNRLEELCRAIAHWEDGRAPWADADLQGGMRLCSAWWGTFRAIRLGQPGAAQPHPSTPAALGSDAEITEALNQQQLDRMDASRA